MATQISKVTAELRNMILSGELAPGERVVELAFSARLGVSRTPLRIALTELEREGLLERLPARGFRVCSFTEEEIGDAIEVRGALEGMAARTLAERGASPEVLAQLQEAVAAGQALLAPAIDDVRAPVDARAWGRINQRFHETLCQASRNRALLAALALNNKTPLVSPGAMTLPASPSTLETPWVLRAQSDHEDILQAITQRQAARAESLMREHAWRSWHNKRLILAAIRSQRHGLFATQPAPANPR